jgi:hypothetical protein
MFHLTCCPRSGQGLPLEAIDSLEAHEDVAKCGRERLPLTRRNLAKVDCGPNPTSIHSSSCPCALLRLTAKWVKGELWQGKKARNAVAGPALTLRYDWILWRTSNI